MLADDPRLHACHHFEVIILGQAGPEQLNQAGALHMGLAGGKHISTARTIGWQSTSRNYSTLPSTTAHCHGLGRWCFWMLAVAVVCS